MNIKLYITCLIMIAVFTGCKKETDSSINQQYNITYDKTAKRFTGEAIYQRQVGAGPVILGNGGYVKLNDIDPVYSEDGAYYHWHLQELPDASRFVFAPGGGTEIVNTVTKEEIGDIEFDSVPDTLYKTDGYSFSWKGLSLRPGEKISYFLFDDASQIIRYSESGNTVMFTRADLKDRVTGSATLTVSRYRNLELKQGHGTAKGKITTGISVSREIVIVD